MSSDSDESLDTSYRADDGRSTGARGSFRRPDGRQAWRSPPSEEGDKLDGLLRPAPVHPVVERDNDAELLRADPPGSPFRQSSDAASSLSLSSLSSSMEITVVKPTLPPQIPALHRLSHLKTHMKQLKRLYRQEAQQEELAQRDALLQMLCTSSITMFRHCPSRARFFTAIRALLSQYLPALDSKLFEVEHFDGRFYLVAQAKDEAGARDQDTSSDVKAVELSKQSIVDQWERIGIAGRAAALAETSFTRDDVARSPSPARQLDLGCIKRWGRRVADYVVPCPNKHLVLQFPAAELLQIGFRPEIDLAIPSLSTKKAHNNIDLSSDRFESRRRGHTHQDQGLPELRLLVVVLQDTQGGAVAVFEAVMDASTRVTIEFLDAFGVLLASAIEMRRKVCRSTMGEVDVQIRRRSTTNDPVIRVPVLRVPISSTTDGLFTGSEIVAFNSGAVLEETDSALLRALRKPVESLLVDNEARAREIAFHKLVVTSVNRMWDRLRDQLYTYDVHGWRQYLRSALGDMLTNSDNGCSVDDSQRFKHIHVLFPGENADNYRTAYTIVDASHIEGPTTLSREFEILKQVVKSRQSMESIESGAHLTAVPVDVRARVTPGDSTCSVIGVLVALENVDGDDGDLLRKVNEHLFPVMYVVVQAFMELAENHTGVFQLENDLSATRISSEHYERGLALSKAIVSVVERWTACGSIEELVDSVAAVNTSEISESLAAMKLLVVDTVGINAGSGDHPCECIWTAVDGLRVTIGNSNSQSFTAKELVRLVICSHDVEHDTVSVAQDSETQRIGNPEQQHHVFPLHSPADNSVVLGALELDIIDTMRRPDVISAVDPLLRLLPLILNAHIKVQSTQSTWAEQMKSLSEAHKKQWNSMMQCTTQWSRLPLSDCLWRERTSALCRKLVSSADFVNVFLNFGDNDAVSKNSVATKLMTKDCEQVMDGDTRNELCLHNQCVLGATAHYSLNNGDELLGVLVASKKSEVPFSDQEHQLLQLFAQLVSAQANTRRTREEARLQMASLNNKLDQQSRATQQLVKAHTSVSVRAQQLLMLLGVTKLGQAFQDHGLASHDAVVKCLQSVVQQTQNALKSFGSREVVVAVVIDRSDLSKLTCSVIKGIDTASGLEESVVCAPLGRDEDDACCWYRIRRWVRHSPPFSALPPRVLQLMGLASESNDPSHAPVLLTILPIDLNGAEEVKGSVVLLAITSFEAGGLMDDSFIGELVESVANLLCSRLQELKLNESAHHLSESVATLDSELLELQQDSRLLELTQIVWMEVVGSGSPDLANTVGSEQNDSIEPETERPILQCLRKSFHDRIVPFLREELRICAVELVFDFEEPVRDQLSKRNSIVCFMNSIDPSRAQSLKSSTDCVTLGTDTTSASYPTPRFWLVHRFLPRETEDRRCFGLFYIEWELLSPSITDAAAENTKRTLVWLSDWLQTLAQFCFDRCSALDQICSKEHEIRDLTLRNQSLADCIKVHAYWNDRWTSLLKFARALQTESCEPSETTAIYDGSSDWELVFAQLSALSDTVIWSREGFAQGDRAWTIRPDGTRQYEKWSEVLSWLECDPEQFQLIVGTSSPPESLGVLELVKYGNQPWSSEHAKYRELVSLIVGSYVTTIRMSRSNEQSCCVIQTACERLEAEIHQLRQDTAHSWSIYQQMEKWIQQLFPPRDTVMDTTDTSVLQALFGRIERQLVDTSRKGENEIVQARLLLQIDVDQDVEIIASCDSGCKCHTAPSLVDILKQIDASSSKTAPVTVTHVDNLPKMFLTCDTVRPKDTSGSKTHCVVLRPSSKDNHSCTLMLCVQMKTSDQKSVTMLLLEVLCLRLGDAASQFIQASRERKHSNVTDQRLSAINCELDLEKRRSTRIIAALATATRCISDALSVPGDASGPTIISAVEAVAQCFVDNTTIVKCESAASASDSSTVSAISDNAIADVVGNRHRLAIAEDGIVECVRSAEAEISRIELEVQGARILLTAPGPSERTDLSQLWQDNAALQLIVKLSNTVVAIKHAKAEAVTHRHECDSAMTTLRAKCEALEVTCLEAKTALERSEMQRSLMRATMKQVLEPVPTQSVELITRLSSDACASREAVIQALGDALVEMHAVEGVAIRESSPGATRTLFTSRINLLGEKQSILTSDQIGRIVDRCVARQETEILSLKTSNRDTLSTEDSERICRNWLAVVPCIIDTTSIVVLLMIPSGRSASRKDLHQVNHARLLIRLAVWRCEQLVNSATLTARVEHLVKGQQDMDYALQHTKLQLGRAHEEQKCYQRMLRGFAHDVFQALSWSDKTWERVFPSTRKLVALWQHLSNVVRDRIATGFASVRTVRVHMFGVIRSQNLVIHLPTASTEFAYSTMMVLAANPSTRRVWDTLANPVSPDHGLAKEEENGSTTVVVPVCIQNDSGRDDLPTGAIVVTMVQQQESGSHVFGDEQTRAMCDLVGELAPFLGGILRAVRVKGAGITPKDQRCGHQLGTHQSPVNGAAAVDMGRATNLFSFSLDKRSPRSPYVVDRCALSRPGGELGHERDACNQLESINVLASNNASRQDMHSIEEADKDDKYDDEEDGASTTTSLDSSQGTPKMARAADERLVRFLLKTQRANGVKALQRLVADELKGVCAGRSSRSAPNINFELITLFGDSKEEDQGQTVDSVHSVLLPEVVLTEVLRRIKSLRPSQQPLTPQLWKFRPGKEGRRATSDEFWVAVFTQKSTSSALQVATGLLVVRGVRLQSEFSRHDAEISLTQALQGLQQQLVQIRRDAELQAQISDLQRHEVDNNEQIATLAQIETRHHHLNTFSELALRMSVAESESELVRATSRYLRDFLECRRVVYEPSKRDLSMSTVANVQENQEPVRDESVMVELDQSLCYEDGHRESNNSNRADGIQQVTQLATSSSAVEVQHAIKLRVFSALSEDTSSRLLGTFTAHLEPGSALLSNVECQGTLKSVASLVNASFHRLQALGLAQKHVRDGKFAVQEQKRFRKENSQLRQAQEQYRLSAGTLQQQVEDLARVNSDMESELADLHARLQQSEACRGQSEQDAVIAQQQLVKVVAAADEAQVARKGASQLQEVVEAQQERIRVLEKRNMKRRLQAQQLADEVGRLKKTEEIDKFRVAELEKKLAVAQQQQVRTVDHSGVGIGSGGRTTRLDASNINRRRVGASERHVSRQQERATTVQKLKQMRLAEELRCLAALEVRELHTRQGELGRVRRAASTRGDYISDSNLKRVQHSDQLPLKPPV